MKMSSKIIQFAVDCWKFFKWKIELQAFYCYYSSQPDEIFVDDDRKKERKAREKFHHK